MKKNKKSRIFILIILCIMSFSIGIYAVNKYSSEEFIYTKEDGSSVTLSVALNELYNNRNSKTECEKDNFCSKVKIGDYIKMTPTKTSYVVDSTKTGWKESSDYSSDDTINPSELNLWRVIKKNDNGTIEMVSEYVSSTDVHFYDKTGYLNFVGELNKIASQYENSKYTTNSRIMGYNGQTEYITDIDTSKLTTTDSYTKDNSNEILGGGDIMYEKDTNLVMNALGTRIATNLSGTLTNYWVGSRYYRYSSSCGLGLFRRIMTNSDEGGVGSTFFGTRYDSSGCVYFINNDGYSIRPILTLKSGLTATGSGTSNNPWVLK